MLSGSRKEPIQHLPFFSSTDLDIGAAAGNDEPASSGSSRMGKLEAAR